MAKPETRIYTGDYTARDISRQFDWFEDFGSWCSRAGLLDMDLDQNPINHPGYRYRTDKVDFNQVTVVADGTINVGDYSLACSHTQWPCPRPYLLV